jgi:Fe2+ or Zn2+ uptake regulation protein
MGAVTDGGVDEVIAGLRAAGERITTPKRALVSALLASDSHVTAEELVATVQDRHPDVNRSTVYRILRGLEERGIVEHAHLGHGPAVYHLRDRSHHHLVCEVCGHVEEIPDAALNAIVRRLRTDFGFAANPRHFAISGRCRSCAPH